MTEVVLIRPGSTLYDEQNRVQGVLDLPLTEQGREQVQRLAVELKAVGLSALYCGPGESLVTTADCVARACGLRSKRVEELRNLDHGLWQGLQVEEIRRRNPKLYRQWIDEPLTICPPEGETVEEAQDRLRQVLKPILKRHREERIGVVVAEPLARVIACLLKPDKALTLGEVAGTCGYERIGVEAEVQRNGDGR